MTVLDEVPAALQDASEPQGTGIETQPLAPRDTSSVSTAEAARDETPRVASRWRRCVTVRRVVASAVLLLLVAIFAVVTVGVGSGNWQIQPVLSGSMAPGLPVGGVVMVQRVPTSSLQVRDVILFHPPGEATKTYVHRIVSLDRVGATDVIRTQGDANRIPDPWTLRLEGKWAYEARYSVPFVGYVAVWFHSTTGRRVLLSVAGALIVLCGALLFVSQVAAIRRRRPPDQAPPSGLAG